MTEIDLSKLAEPFAPETISWRVGSTTQDKSKGMALAYIDARDVQDRLNAVCGIENWQVRHPWSDGKRLACEIGIRVNGEWIWKGDGAGETDVEAEKGSFSDSFKRAAVRWGVGRYLYDFDSPWVALKAAGRSYQIDPSELPRLRGLLAKSGGNRAPEPAQRRETPTAYTNGQKVSGPAAPAPSAMQALANEILAKVKATKNRDDLNELLVIREDDLASIKRTSEKAYTALQDNISKQDKLLAEGVML